MDAGVRQRPNALIVSSTLDAATPDEFDIPAHLEYLTRQFNAHFAKILTRKFSDDGPQFREYCAERDIGFVVNMVESIGGKGEFIALAPLLFETMRIPFTGSGSAAIANTNDKLLCKGWLKAAGVPTPAWLDAETAHSAPAGKTYIVKSVTEHASIGMDQSSVCMGRAAIAQRMRELSAATQSRAFAEEFIDGREFNVSILETQDGPLVPPIAEMTFVDYPQDMHRIVDYHAKWNTGSFAESHTVRKFLKAEADRVLCERIAEMARRVWTLFGLSGWARVDFRMDAMGALYVIDVNANPDLSADAGFMSACREAGLDKAKIFKAIADAAFRRSVRL
jgi:D-alanine-D-alanine ligase